MKTDRFPRIPLGLILGLLIPLLAYTAFQYAQSNKSEALLRSIYERELESLLFSVNQHCWDVYNSWVTELHSIVSAWQGNERGASLRRLLKTYMEGKRALEGVLVARTDGRVLTYAFRSPSRRRHLVGGFRSIVEQHQRDFERAFRQAEKGYIRPVVLGSQPKTDGESWVVFPIRLDSGRLELAGLLIDEWHFVNEVAARKLNAINNGQFLFSVLNERSGRIVYETEEIEDTQFERTEKLWILPDLQIRVRLRGTTLDQIARGRTRRNLLYLGIVNLVIILATVFLLRNVGHEMRLARMKTDFVANVSHELRTPLSLIRMYAEMLEMGRVPDEGKKKHYYRTIMNEAARLTQLINNILDFARLEAKRKQYSFQPISLNEIVDETLQMFRYPLKQRGFELSVELDDELPLIQGDRQAVTQALVNLMDNAIKFSRERRSIRIETGREDGGVFLAITDQGVGIPESQQRKIFEKFYRIGSTLVHETKGSGLGLAIVKHIMDDHGGEVRVRSKPGEGSTFTLVFPIATEDLTNGPDSRR